MPKIPNIKATRISIAFALALPAFAAAQPDFVLPDGLFPIMSWESAPKSVNLFQDPNHGLGSLADCGFTVAAFPMPKLLPMCEQLGLGAIVAEQKPDLKWKGLTDDDILSAVKHLVDESSGSKAVLGYLLEDEPGASEFPALGKAVAAVRKLAPGKLAYVTLYPSYATLAAKDISQLQAANYEEYLERFVSEVKPQIISYDNYRVQYSNDLKTTAGAVFFTNLLTVRQVAMKHGLPFWNIVSSNQIRKYTPIPSPANLMLQAYATLAAGGQGVTWFTYYAHAYGYGPIDKEGHKSPLWSYLRMVNEQLKIIGPQMLKLKSTGVFFTSPAPGSTLPLLPGQLVESATAESPLMIGEFTGPNDSKYVMVVNLSLERSSKFHVKTTGNYPNTRYISPADGSLAALEPDQSLWLAAGQGVLLLLQ